MLEVQNWFNITQKWSTKVVHRLGSMLPHFWIDFGVDLGSFWGSIWGPKWWKINMEKTFEKNDVQERVPRVKRSAEVNQMSSGEKSNGMRQAGGGIKGGLNRSWKKLKQYLTRSPQGYGLGRRIEHASVDTCAAHFVWSRYLLVGESLENHAKS